MNRIHKKLWILLQFSLVPPGPIFGMKFTISCEFGPLRVKWWYHMFSSIKIEEYMESELSGIFQVKLFTKNILCLWGLVFYACGLPLQTSCCRPIHGCQKFNYSILKRRSPEKQGLQKVFKTFFPMYQLSFAKCITKFFVSQKVLLQLYFQNCSLYHGTLIWTRITYKKILCYMCDSFCRWFIVERAKIF